MVLMVMGGVCLFYFILFFLLKTRNLRNGFEETDDKTENVFYSPRLF